MIKQIDNINENIKQHLRDNVKAYILILFSVIIGIIVGIYLGVTGYKYTSLLTTGDKLMFDYITGTASYMSIFYSRISVCIISIIIIFVFNLTYYLSFFNYLYININELFNINAELALKIAQNWYELDKKNVFSRRLLEGLSGASLNSNDSKYAKKLFDVFADNYDETMDKLESSIIKKFSELNPCLNGNILELGVGTGNAVKVLKNNDNCFDGVDVSKNMLEIARKNGGYNNLYCMDIETFVTKHNLDCYDMIVGFDVFCYIGDLKNILKALKGKELWFSIEKTDERASDFYLTPNGRYKHSLSYIEKIKEELKSEVFQVFELVLRKENGNDVEGFLINIK